MSSSVSLSACCRCALAIVVGCRSRALTYTDTSSTLRSEKWSKCKHTHTHTITYKYSTGYNMCSHVHADPFRASHGICHHPLCQSANNKHNIAGEHFKRPRMLALVWFLAFSWLNSHLISSRRLRVCVCGWPWIWIYHSSACTWSQSYDQLRPYQTIHCTLCDGKRAVAATQSTMHCTNTRIQSVPWKSEHGHTYRPPT